MAEYGKIKGRLSAPRTLSGRLSSPETLAGRLTVPSSMPPPAYKGEYKVTPTEQTQVLETKDLWTTKNITIDPIPSNYGRIEWNGIVMTIT